MPTSADVITAEAPGAWITVANRRGQGQKPLGQRKLIRSDEAGQFPAETHKKKARGEQWEKSKAHSEVMVNMILKKGTVSLGHLMVSTY